MKSNEMKSIEVKNLIADIVAEKQGCKITELVAIPEVALAPDVLNLIEELIEEGRIIEIEYEVPNIPGRLKSFLLPQGSILY